MSPPTLTLGTAGHIDHGKTALVEALTGVNTDRLPAERARGISIELGYARLALPSGRALSVVDVPGHERFVRTMVAGATGIDLFLMTVAADDGVMPQTREHAAVLAALGVDAGVVAVTRSDLADPARAAGEARELLPEAEVVATSAREGTGLDELRAALERVAAGLPGRAGPAPAAADARLHVDRVFSVRGAGTVVTGTLWSGSLGAGDRVALLPRGVEARVRAVQIHDTPVERAAAGQRVAVNLARVSRTDVARGDVLVAAGRDDLRPTWILDARLELSEPVDGRVQVHHGTRETPGRVRPLGDGYHQLRLERPLVAAPGDRVVVRRIAPPDTLGGGVVLDPGARRHGSSPEVVARLVARERGEVPRAEPAPRRRSKVADAAPLSPAAVELEQRLRAAGVAPPGEAELGEAAGELRALRAAGRAVRVGRLYYHPEVLAEVERRVVELCETHGSVTIAGLRDELEVSRRYAQALLEHFDAARVTRREGDVHVLRRRAAGRA